MKIRTAIISALIVLALAATASAQDGRLVVGLRGSFGLPFGSAGDATNLDQLASRAIPVQLDVDYRIDEDWRPGIYLFYGPTMVADEAKAELAAQGMTGVTGHRQQRLGVQVTRDFRRQAQFSPWVGVAAGYDWTRYVWARLANGAETELGVSGFHATLQAGGDYKVTPRFSVGPFAAFDLGRYRRNLVWVEDGGETSIDIADKGVHQWMRFGVKLAYAF